jgi:phosphoribosylformylglycinamidine cyclo-ligase
MGRDAYAKAGVDITLGNRVKSGLGALVRSTRRPGVIGGIGGFGGCFDGKIRGYRRPVLVASIDGVGTKLKVAQQLGRHGTIGEDLVNHCVNDIAALGAEPLFFLDYIGTGKLDPKVFRQILAGLVRGCRRAGCALLGGETAQMPGIYQGKDYDLVGSIVGVLEKGKATDGRTIRPGDVLLGLPSNGLQTNGYTLAREILLKKAKLRLGQKLPGTSQTLGNLLLAVHPNYRPALRKIAKNAKIKGAAHITGGGLIDNPPRVFPRGTAAEIQLGSWPVPPLFRTLVAKGRLNLTEAYRTFNMGIGMIVVVARQDVAKVRRAVRCYEIGRIVKGDRKVKLVR